MAILGGILSAFNGSGNTVIVIPATSAAVYEPYYLLSQIKTVDGSGSGLDADLLDGYHSSYFGTAAQVINLQNTDISLQSQISNLFAIGSRLVFKEIFTGNGSSTGCVLTGSLQNAGFSVGSWSAANILVGLQVDVTDLDGKPIYDSNIPMYRDRIAVTSIDSFGNVTFNFPPQNGQQYAIWYWYQLQASNVLSYYYREDHVAAMEGDSVQMATQVDTDTTAYGNIVLRTTDNTVQKSLNRLDNVVQSLVLVSSNPVDLSPYTLLSTTASVSGSLNVRLTSVENNYATKNATVAGTYNTITVNGQGIVASGSNADYATNSTVAASSGSLQTQINTTNTNINNLASVTGSYLIAGNLAPYTLLTTTASVSAGLNTRLTAVENNYVSQITSISGSILVSQNGHQYNIEVATAPIQSHNSLSGIQGGTTNEYYHLTAAQNADFIGKTEVRAISGGLNTRLTTVENNYATKNATSAGTYNTITVNGQGIVTSGSNADYATNATVQIVSGSLQTQINTSNTNINNLASVTGSYLTASSLTPYTLLTTTATVSGGLNTRLTTVESNYATKATPVVGTYNTVTINGQGIVTSGSNIDYATNATVQLVSGNLQAQITSISGSYATISSLGSYLPLAGGTMNGPLIANRGIYSNSIPYINQNESFGYATFSPSTIAGNYNTAFGVGAGSSIDSGSQNTFLGASAGLFNTTGGYNIGVGSVALGQNINGSFNIAIGRASLTNAQSTSYNIAIGTDSMFNNNYGNRNTVIGYQVLLTSISGNNNTAVGYKALFSGNGNNNIAIGYGAGYAETGSNKLIIDYDIDGNHTSSNSFIYGDFSSSVLNLNATRTNVKSLYVNDLVATSGNVVIHDASGKLVDSGTSISSIQSNPALAAQIASISGNYATTATVASISGNLQAQINSINVVGSTGINVVQSPSKTWTISLNGGIQGRLALNTGTSTYTINHQQIDNTQAYPVVSLDIPTSASDIFVQGIYNRTPTSFSVVLSHVPSLTGYGLLWHISSAVSGSTGFTPYAGAGMSVSSSGSNYIFAVNDYIGASSALTKANNLSDVASANTARNNINRGLVNLGTLSGNIATDCSLGNCFTVTISGASTLTNPTNMAAGATYNWIVKQDGTGGRTLSFGNAFKFPSAYIPTATSGAGSVDIYSGLSDGSVMYMGAIFDMR